MHVAKCIYMYLLHPGVVYLTVVLDFKLKGCMIKIKKKRTCKSLLDRFPDEHFDLNFWS